MNTYTGRISQIPRLRIFSKRHAGKQRHSISRSATEREHRRALPLQCGGSGGGRWAEGAGSGGAGQRARPTRRGPMLSSAEAQRTCQHIVK